MSSRKRTVEQKHDSGVPASPSTSQEMARATHGSAFHPLLSGTRVSVREPLKHAYEPKSSVVRPSKRRITPTVVPDTMSRCVRMRGSRADDETGSRRTAEAEHASTGLDITSALPAPVENTRTPADLALDSAMRCVVAMAQRNTTLHQQYWREKAEIEKEALEQGVKVVRNRAQRLRCWGASTTLPGDLYIVKATFSDHSTDNSLKQRVYMESKGLIEDEDYAHTFGLYAKRQCRVNGEFWTAWLVHQRSVVDSFTDTA